MTEGTSNQDGRAGGISHRTAAWLVWSLYGLLICLSTIWSGVGLLGQGGSRNVLFLTGEALISLAAPVVFAIVAALIVSRQPRNALGWVLMVPVGLYVVGGPIASYLESLAPSPPEPTLPILLMAWFNSWNWLLLIIPLLFIMLLFPNGRPPTPRWRWVGVAAIVWAALFVLLTVLLQQINAATTPNLVFDNPIGVLGKDTVARLVGCMDCWLAGACCGVCAGPVCSLPAGECNRARADQVVAVCLRLVPGGVCWRFCRRFGRQGQCWRLHLGRVLRAKRNCPSGGDRHRHPPLPSLRHRRGHQPYPRLRFSDRLSWRWSTSGA